MLWTAPPPARPPRFGGAKHASVTTIGLDIAKSVFQIHGVDAAGNVIVRRQLKRRFQKLPSCLIGIEACASSHHSVSRCRIELARTFDIASAILPSPGLAAPDT